MPRVNLPIASQNYETRSRKLNAERLVNMYPEVNPTARQTVAYHTRPGLTSFASIDGPDRGMHRMNETLYAVGGGFLWSVDSAGTVTNLGIVGGSDRCVMADDGQQLLIATGGAAYVYTLGGSVLEVSDTDLYSPTWFAYLNSQFIFDQNNGTFGQWGTSEVTATFSVDPLDTAEAEAFPDDVIRGITFNQYLYLFGPDSVEVWYNSGTGRPPFARVQGGVRKVGIAGTHAICATPEALYFLDGERIPRRGTGFDYQNIGHPALGVEFAKYGRISDCVVSSWVIDHQRFVQYSFPTANRTWCFHEPSGRWFRMVYGKDLDKHRGLQVVEAYGLNYTVDHSDGTVWQFDQCAYIDGTEPIRRIATMPPIHGGLFQAPGQKLFFNSTEFIIGQGPCDVQALGPGPEPTPALDTELCGSLDDLEQGDALGVTPMHIAGAQSTRASSGDLNKKGIVPAASKNVSLTLGLARENAPAVTASRNGTAWLLGLYDTTSPARHQFAAYMDSNGYIQIYGRNSAGTEILNVQITNNGGSFAGGSAHIIGMVVDMSSVNRREIWVDGEDVTNNASYVTWNTYTDDEFYFDVRSGGGGVARLNWGYDEANSDPWGAYNTEADEETTLYSTDSIGFCSFDNTCSLIPAGIWTDDGWVRDPQAWNGWYLTQPLCFFAGSMHRNTGSWGRLCEAPAWDPISGGEYLLGGQSIDYADTAAVNYGIGANV